MTNPRNKLSPPVLILGLVVLMAITVILTSLYAFHETKVRSKALLAEIEAKGQPSNPRSLAKAYFEMGAATDLTTEWQRVLDNVSGITIADIPPPGEPWPDRDKVEQFFEVHAELRNRVHELTKKKGKVRFSHDFSIGPAMRLEYVHLFRQLARFLTLEAYLHAHDGDDTRFTDSIEAILITGDTLKDEPWLISMLVRLAIRGLAIGAVQDNLRQLEFSNENLVRLRSRLQQVNHFQGLRNALIGERAIMSNCFEHPELLSEYRTSIGVLPTRYSDLCYYLESMNKMVDASEQGWPDAWHRIQQIDGEMTAELDATSFFVWPQRMFSRILLPSLSATFRASGRSAFLTDACAVATAVEQYELDHGELPATLDLLTPRYLSEIPIDVFDGQVIRYRKTAAGYLLYSVGADGVDDGGKMTGSTSYEPDMVFEVPRPIPTDESE